MDVSFEAQEVFLGHGNTLAVQHVCLRAQPQHVASQVHVDGDVISEPRLV